MSRARHTPAVVYTYTHIHARAMSPPFPVDIQGVVCGLLCAEEHVALVETCGWKIRSLKRCVEWDMLYVYPLNMVAWFVDNMSICATVYEGALLDAMSEDDVGLVEILFVHLKTGLSSATKNYAIRWAALGGHVDMFARLLSDPRVDPGDKNNSALKNALLRSHGEIVKLLLADPRVNPIAKNHRAIEAVTRKGHMDMVRLLLLDGRLDREIESSMALKLAKERGYKDIAKLLLAHSMARYWWRVPGSP